MKKPLNEIKKIIVDLASKISAPENLLPTYVYCRDFAYPHIEVDRSGYLHYVIVERGQELDRKTTSNLDELLYWVFDRVTFSMSTEYEVSNRIKGQDCRRIIFAKQQELLGIH